MPGFHTTWRAWRGSRGALTIPRAGLVAWHDLYFPNILLRSNTFSTSWSKTRSNVVESASVYVPGTTRKAWKCVEDNTAANTHFAFQGVTITGTNTMRVVAKSAERTWLCVNFYVGGVGEYLTYVNLSDGSIGTKDAAVTCTVNPLTDGFHEILVTGDIGAGTVLSYRLYLAEGDNDNIFDGAGHAVGAGVEADPGIYIADAQLYPSATLPPYVATTTLQSIADLSGKGNALTRGSNASAADTNDPTVLGPGLGFDGTGANDDYAATGSLASYLALAGPWTLILAAKNTYAADTGLTALSSAANVYAGINSSGANALKAVSCDAGGATASAGTITATDGTAYVFALANDGTNLTLYRLDDMSSCSAALETMSGNAILTLGAYNGTTGSIQTATIYGDLVYNRVLSAGELRRIHRALKATWAARGVTLA